MGMFDEIVSEFELPDPEKIGEVFQTKNLECSLHLYRITADGQLEVKPYGAHPDYDAEYLATLEHNAATYTGALEFYEFDDSKRWWEYVAFFDQGKLLPPIARGSRHWKEAPDGN